MARKLTYDFVRQEFEKENYKLISNKYVNAKTMLQFVCDVGHKDEITYDKFKRGQRCAKCAGRFKYEDVKEYFRNNNCKLVSNKYTAINQELRYLCSCGKEDTNTFSNFRKGIRCRWCYG
ncbi:hypothetical protein [Niallia oryzisoli]|uniref:hypothetical protein n=1 Tax=Niallia oryzisoli TaxID=1737571 RepID=UPI0037356C18